VGRNLWNQHTFSNSTINVPHDSHFSSEPHLHDLTVIEGKSPCPDATYPMIQTVTHSSQLAPYSRQLQNQSSNTPQKVKAQTTSALYTPNKHTVHFGGTVTHHIAPNKAYSPPKVTDNNTALKDTEMGDPFQAKSGSNNEASVFRGDEDQIQEEQEHRREIDKQTAVIDQLISIN
jgi:hypothetical protein